jgi:Ser/Thr protein kinase RdoA (MazF antagonist)
METHVAQLFKKEYLLQSAAAFQVNPGNMQELDGFENFIYEGQTEQTAVILRLSHSSKKDRIQIGSELAFVNYLVLHGAGVARPLGNHIGQLVSEIPLSDGSYFSAVCFEKAPGRHPQGADFNPVLYRAWGSAMGKMHRLSRTYIPPQPSLQRIHWNEEVEVTRAAYYLPAGQQRVVEMVALYTQRLQQLPVTAGNYGVIHNDLHPYNFLYDGINLTMIDFEDSVQMWYIADLVTSLFMVSVWPPHGLSREDFTRSFWPHFVRGYRQENDLPHEWLASIPLFLKFRELGMYVAFYRACDMENLDPWPAHFLNGRRERIEQDLPYMDLMDWEALSTT